VFSEIISHLANLSFSQGIFPTKFKFAVVSPLLKKPGLDADNPANFRPISNLNNISIILERLFLARLQPHVTSSPNFNQSQSAYRQHHSTETALLVTLDSIFRSSDAGMPTTLISLDLSAAFDMIDHRTLLSRLHTSFGVSGVALNFIESYLSGRTQCVRAGQASSSSTSCHTGVPQGSVLGPYFFPSSPHPSVALHPLLAFPYSNTLMILSSSLQLQPTPSTPVLLNSSSALLHFIRGSASTAWLLTGTSLKRSRLAPGRSFVTTHLSLESASPGPLYLYQIISKLSVSPLTATLHSIVMFPLSASLPSTTHVPYAIFVIPLRTIWLRPWLSHLFSLALIMRIPCFLAYLRPTFTSSNESRTPWLALFSDAIHAAPQAVCYLSSTGYLSNTAFNLNLPPSPTGHSPASSHHFFPLSFIPTPPLLLTPYVHPTSTFLQSPDVGPSLVSAPSVTHPPGFGTISLLIFVPLPQ